MTCFPLAGLCLLVTATLRADDLGGRVEITPVAGWMSVDPRQPGEAPRSQPTLTYIPRDGRNASVSLTLFTGGESGVNDVASLKQFHHLASAPFVPSPNATYTVTEFKFADGIGVFTTFEDPDLIGKPPQAGEYKLATEVAVLLNSGFTVQATVFGDTSDSTDFRQAMQIVLSAKPRAVASSAPPVASAAAGIEVAMPSLQAVLRLPANRFKPSGVTLNQDPGYFSYTDAQGMILSGWLDRAAAFNGIRPFWTAEKAALEQRGFKINDDAFKTVAGWDVITYTVPQGDKLAQKHIRACRVVGNTWADVHLSLSSPDASWTQLEDTLKSLTLEIKKP